MRRRLAARLDQLGRGPEALAVRQTIVHKDWVDAHCLAYAAWRAKDWDHFLELATASHTDQENEPLILTPDWLASSPLLGWIKSR
jgi:hypothetical protein